MEASEIARHVYALAVLSVAYFVRGIAGFGSGLIAIPLLLMWFPLLVAVPLVVALDYLASASQGIKDRQAIRWREIWPLLRRDIPESRLVLVGSEPNAKIVSLESRAVRVTGTVPSVEPFLAKARLFVAPVRLGRGIKGKILEAFASGDDALALRRFREAFTLA